MELECYSQPTCNKLCASSGWMHRVYCTLVDCNTLTDSSHDALDRRSCNPQARPSTSSVDHTINLPWRNFLSSEFKAKFPRKVPLFLVIPAFPYNTVYGRLKEAATPKTSCIRLVVSIQYRLVTDRQTHGRTDRHDDSV